MENCDTYYRCARCDVGVVGRQKELGAKFQQRICPDCWEQGGETKSYNAPGGYRATPPAGSLRPAPAERLQLIYRDEATQQGPLFPESAGAAFRRARLSAFVVEMNKIIVAIR